MIIYLDTEFTNFVSPALISMGLVAESGEEFYAERNDLDLSTCTHFVKAVVLPKLGRFPDRILDSGQLRDQLTAWLSQFALREPTIAYDFDVDWVLFGEAMGGEIPSWLCNKNVDDQIHDLAREWFYVENGLDDHHALHDARANRAAFWGRK